MSEPVKLNANLELKPLDTFETVALARGAGSIHVSLLSPQALSELLARFRVNQFKKAGLAPPEANPPAPPPQDQGATAEPGAQNALTLYSPDGKVLYRAAVDSHNDLVAAAIRNRVDMSYADLSGMHLRNIDFSGCDVRRMVCCRTKLKDCTFVGCDLRGVNFVCAELEDCNFANAFFTNETVFTHAYVTDCRFTGARLIEAVLVGDRPIFTLGPLGDKSRGLTVFLTDRGIYVRTGCHNSYLPAFIDAVKEKHKHGSRHRAEYMAAIKLIKTYAKLWMPKRKWFSRK